MDASRDTKTLNDLVERVMGLESSAAANQSRFSSIEENLAQMQAQLKKLADQPKPTVSSAPMDGDVVDKIWSQLAKKADKAELSQMKFDLRQQWREDDEKVMV